MQKLLHWPKRQVYQLSEGSRAECALLGKKGSNLAEMFRLGINVPVGFIISTEACIEFRQHMKTASSILPQGLATQINTAMHELEKQSGLKFGGIHMGDMHGIITSTNQTEHFFPLLLSIRSGAPVSMKGISETVLNLGLTQDLVDLMAKFTQNAHWAYTLYKQFLQLFGTVVLGIDNEKYVRVLEKAKIKRNVVDELTLTTADLQHVIAEFKAIAQVPDDPWEQLSMTIAAMFSSWDSPTARAFRAVHNIAEDLGTAIIVQRMVYGQMNQRSGTGTIKTRSGITGDKNGVDGEFHEHSIMALGAEFGIRSVMPMVEFPVAYPSIYRQLLHIMSLLERRYKDMQEIEFVVENEVLFILETYTGSRTPPAAVRIAVDMVEEELISPKEALLRVDPHAVVYFAHTVIDPSTDTYSKAIGKGYYHSGAPTATNRGLKSFSSLSFDGGSTVTGKVALSSKRAVEGKKVGEDCILVMNEMGPEDLEGLEACVGAVAAHGDCLASIVMGTLGKPVITCANSIILDRENGRFLGTTNALTPSMGTDMQPVYEGDEITIDPASGIVYLGHVPTITGCDDTHFSQLLSWATNYARMQIMALAESMEDLTTCRVLGADGIGGFSMNCILECQYKANMVLEMLLFEGSEFEAKRSAISKQLVSFNRTDMRSVFRHASSIGNTSVHVSLLSSLSAFIPTQTVTITQTTAQFQYPSSTHEIVKQIADDMELPLADVWTALKQAGSEEDTRSSHGASLAVLYPELLEMQIRSIVGGALDAMREGIPVHLGIVLPAPFSEHEVDHMIKSIRHAVGVANDEYFALYQQLPPPVALVIGCVIDSPRGCIRAHHIAAHSAIDFIVFDTEQLTEHVFGITAHEAHAFLPTYVEKHLISGSPLVSIDISGVGAMVRKAAQEAKRTCETIRVGIRGRHASDPSSISFFSGLQQVDYLCCAPRMVPTARIAAAQAHVRETRTI